MKSKFIILASSILIPFNCLFAEVVPFDQYKNEEYKFEINKPKDWIIIDKQHHAELFNQMQLQSPTYAVICSFFTKNPDINPAPCVTIGVSIYKEKINIDEYLVALNKTMKDYENIIEKPKIINLGEKRVIKSTARMIQPVTNKTVIAETYLFFEGNYAFNVGTLAYPQEYDSFKQVFKEMIASFNYF